MLYMGIDIGKNHHEAGIIDAEGNRRGSSLRFANDEAGYIQLTSYMAAKCPVEETLKIGMEATGHYWLALYSYLIDKSREVTVINPLQSDSFRNFQIRKAKTDAIDAFLIAEVIRFGQFTATHLADEDMLAMRSLARFREGIVATCSDYKRKVIAVLDQVFPEYEKIFSDVFGQSSKAFLKTYGTPEQCLEVNTRTLATMLKKASRGSFGIDKARQLKEAAKRSCGIKLATEALAFQLQLLILQIEFTENQVAQIDKQLKALLDQICPVVLSIPGVGPALGAMIVSEIGDITRFSNPKKLVAFAGIDPSVQQSGNFVGTRNRMSKRGSPHLRDAIWLAGTVAARTDPVFKAYYEKKRSEGKAYGTAMGAVARKLTYTIHAVLMANKPYEVRLPKEESVAETPSD